MVALDRDRLITTGRDGSVYVFEPASKSGQIVVCLPKTAGALSDHPLPKQEGDMPIVSASIGVFPAVFVVPATPTAEPYAVAGGSGGVFYRIALPS